MWILIISLAFGAVLRWLYIGRHSFWYDETFSTLTARLPLSQILSNAAIDVHPPGYYVLLHFWLGLGQSEAIIRSFSAMFSLGAIGLIYGLTRWLFDKSVAALAALLMAILPFQVYFAQEARMYSLVIFLAIALMWVFLYAVTTHRRWPAWAGYVIIAVVGLYIHYFMAFLLLALHIWFVIGWRQYRTAFWHLVMVDGLIAVLFLPQINQALNRADYYLGIEAWQGVPSVLSPLTTIYYLLFAHRAPIWVAPAGLFLTLAILILTFWEGRRRKGAVHNFELSLWLSLIIPIVVVAVISWLAPRSIYVERSFAVSSPVLVMLLARGTMAAPKMSPTPYLTLLLMIPVGVTLFTHISTPDPAKPPVREVVQTIELDFGPNDVALHLQDASAIPALWYSKQPHLVVDAQGARFIFSSTHRLFGSDVVAWQPALADANRLWLTVMPGFVGPQQQAVFDEIDSTYSLIMKYDWGSVQLYLYDLTGRKE